MQLTLGKAPGQGFWGFLGTGADMQEPEPHKGGFWGRKAVRKELQHLLLCGLLFLGTVCLQVARAKQTEWLGAAGDLSPIWWGLAHGDNRPQPWGTWSR